MEDALSTFGARALINDLDRRDLVSPKMSFNESFDFSQSSQWPPSDSSSSVSPTTFDMNAANPFDMAAAHAGMSGQQASMAEPFNPFALFDHAAYAAGAESGQHHFPDAMVNMDESSPNTDWTSVNSIRGSFSSISTDGSMLEQPPLLGDFTPHMDMEPPKRRRRRNLDPKIRHTEKLEKNRRAAERCRQKQRAYVGALQERAREEEIRRARLVAQVNQLRDAILSLKESMVTHSGCHDERIKQYLLSEMGRNAERRMSSQTAGSTPAMTPAVTPGGFQYGIQGHQSVAMPVA